MMETVEPWVTTEEIAHYLNKPSNWVRENSKRLGIPRVKIGRQWRYKKSQIESWLTRQELEDIK